MSPWKMSDAKSWTYQLRPTWNAASGTHHKALITKRQQEINTNLNTFVKLGKGRRNRARSAATWAAAAAPVQTDSSSGGASELPASASQQTLSLINPQKLRTPLVDAVRQRGDAGHETPFHVPGHKRGAGVPEGLARLVRPATGSVLQYDLTEIAGLDFLSSPSGVIQEAQQLAAEAFGADHTWFLVNGCSVGIHAAVMAVTAAAMEEEEEEEELEDQVGKVQAEDEVDGPIDTTMAAGNTDRSCLIRSMTNGAGPSHMRCVSEYDSNRDGSSISSSSCSSHGGGCGGRINDAGRGRATLIVARNCHLSAFSSMVLSGCEPYWVQPEVDPLFGVAHCVTHESIRAALYGAADQGRRVVGVLIVSPTYFGAVADVAAIAAVCHEHGVPLLVDEAHGGHFAFLPPSAPPPLSPPPSPQPRQQQHNHNDNNNHAEESHQAVRVQDDETRVARREVHLQPLPPSRPASPPSALQCGADVVIQSTHKVLGAMTQAAMLHIAGTRVSPSRLSRALQTLQSSSPSYILMASLDAARAQAAAGGAFDEPCAAAQAIWEAVSQCQRIRLLDERTAGSKASVRYFDPLRLTLLVNDLPQLPGGGFGAAEWLERQFGVVPELATARTVVLALGPGTTRAHAATAVDAILHLDRLAQGVEAGVHATAESTSDVHGPDDHCMPPPPAAGETPPPPPASASPTARVSGARCQVEGKAEAEVEVEVVLTPREAYFAATESVPAAEAVGRVSAELLCPYPPGVPVLFPGERITAAALKVLSSTLTAGGAVTGARDGTLATLTVVATTRRRQLRQ